MQQRFGTLLKCFLLFLVRCHIAASLATIESLPIEDMRNHQSLFCIDVETPFSQERLRYADTTSFTTAMQVLAVAGQWQRSLKILEQMEVGIVAVVACNIFASKGLFHRLGRLYPFEFSPVKFAERFSVSLEQIPPRPSVFSVREARRSPADLLACMALLHAAQEAPAVHHWAVWLAMQEAFTQALACEQNLRKRLEAMVQFPVKQPGVGRGHEMAEKV